MKDISEDSGMLLVADFGKSEVTSGRPGQALWAITGLQGLGLDGILNSVLGRTSLAQSGVPQPGPFPCGHTVHTCRAIVAVLWVLLTGDTRGVWGTHTHAHVLSQCTPSSPYLGTPDMWKSSLMRTKQ